MIALPIGHVVAQVAAGPVRLISFNSDAALSGLSRTFTLEVRVDGDFPVKESVIHQQTIDRLRDLGLTIVADQSDSTKNYPRILVLYSAISVTDNSGPTHFFVSSIIVRRLLMIEDRPKERLVATVYDRGDMGAGGFAGLRGEITTRLIAGLDLLAASLSAADGKPGAPRAPAPPPFRRQEDLMKACIDGLARESRGLVLDQSIPYCACEAREFQKVLTDAERQRFVANYRAFLPKIGSTDPRDQLLYKTSQQCSMH